MFPRFIWLSLFTLIPSAQLVSAHTYIVGITVTGVDQKDWTTVGQASSYMRVPTSNSPVKDLESPFMACNDRGTMEVPGTLEVTAGDTIEPTWWHEGDIGADPVDPSHKGPLTTWISPLEANTKGEVWVQIASEGYYSDSQEWAVNRMIANGGKNKVIIPSSLKAGKYLVRFELIGLHEGQNPGGAQIYPNCAQIEVTGSGQVALPKGVAIPGFYTFDTPGVVYDIYGDLVAAGKAYIAPGTGVWGGTSRYSTDTCREKVDGLAPSGYCQGGSNNTSLSPSLATTRKPSSSEIPSTSTVVSKSPIQAIASSTARVTTAFTTSRSTTESSKLTTIRAASSSTSVTPSSSTPATSSAQTFVDYSSCMLAYNKCLDNVQSKRGGPFDFSGRISRLNLGDPSKAGLSSFQKDWLLFPLSALRRVVSYACR
ncbi:hypothetical protein JCM5353_008428 [Sporobolomyces roseus]